MVSKVGTGGKNVIDSPPPSSPTTRMTGVKVLFGDVMRNSENITVDPRSCIALSKIRGISQSGVLRLKRIFQGKPRAVNYGNVPETVGFVAGSDYPIVMKLEGSYFRYVLDYFHLEKGMSLEDAKEHAQAREDWFGVVDGMHRLCAIISLIEEDPETWEGFCWPVTLLKGGHSLQVLKQLARQQNLKASSKQYVETTLYDQLFGLKAEANRLARETNGSKPGAKQIADAYDGCCHLKDRTMQQLASTAMRLSDEVISTIGEIMNGEHPELVETPTRVPKRAAGKENSEVMSTVDCRVYRKFLNISSLKQATVFMRGQDLFGAEAQIYALHRCKEHCRKNGFKPASYRVVAEQFQKACLALKECRKFETLLESEKWPAHMGTMRQNLLKTTKFDEEVSRNSGNEHEILGSLITKYKVVCPARCKVQIQKYKASLPSQGEEDGNGDTGQEGNENDNLHAESGANDAEALLVEPQQAVVDVEEEMPDLQQADSNPTANAVQKPESIQAAPNVGAPTGTENVRFEIDGTSTAASERLKTSTTLGENGPLLLKSLHIECHQLKWQEYDKTVLSDDVPLFDMVLTDPPYGVPDNPAKAGTNYKNYVDEKEMQNFAQFSRRILCPGGYVVLFSSAKYFYSWVKAFRESDMTVCEYPFVLCKDTTRLQGTRLEHFPQNSSEFAVMARNRGRSTAGFKPDFKSPISLFPCEQKRRYASFINTPIPGNKLLREGSRSPVLTEEKNAAVLGELITSFCPEGGRVLDCYAGTMSTAIAAMMTKRRCVCIEMDAEIYRLALARLNKVAENYSLPVSKKFKANPADVGASTSPTDRNGIEKGNKTMQGGIAGGDEVVLICNGKEVGTALVQSANGDRGGPLSRKIHGQTLDSFSQGDEDLIAILSPCILEDCTKMQYTYCYPSQDDLPSYLGDLHRSGVYVWDANNMRLK